jgi:hypothetical protein
VRHHAETFGDWRPRDALTGEIFMRDIRPDLEERIAVLKEQLHSEQTELERRINQIRQHHDSQVRNLQAQLAALSTVLKVEQRRLWDSPPVHQSADVSPQTASSDHAQPQMRLLDMMVQKLSNEGPASCEDLHRWATREGYLDNNDAVGLALHRALTEVARTGVIRQLPDGTFAALSERDPIGQHAQPDRQRFK